MVSCLNLRCAVIRRIQSTLLILLLGCLPYVATAWQPPMSAAEMETATRLITEAADQQPRAATNTQKNIEPLGREVLLVETLYRKNSKDSKSRSASTGDAREKIAEAFVFDYATGRTTRYLIDVGATRIVEQQAVNSVHLPLNQREQTLAADLALKDKSVFDAIAAEFVREYGQKPRLDEDIDTKIFIWQPTPGDNSRLARECQQQRCAWVSLFTSDSLSLSIEPIVNLMQQTVYLRSDAQ